VHRSAVSLPRLADFDYYSVIRTLTGALLALVLRCDLLGDAGLEHSLELLILLKLKIPGPSRGLYAFLN
jgi:hypothetical protein